MGDVDDRVVVQGGGHRRHEEGDPRRAIRLDHPMDDGLFHSGNRHQLAEAGGPPDAAAIRATLGQRLEDPHRRRAVWARRQGIENFIGVPRQRLMHAAGRVVVLQVEGRHTALRAPLPQIPGAQERVLQHRQLVLVVLDIVEQPEEQARGD